MHHVFSSKKDKKKKSAILQSAFTFKNITFFCKMINSISTGLYSHATCESIVDTINMHWDIYEHSNFCIFPYIWKNIEKAIIFKNLCRESEKLHEFSYFVHFTKNSI
jgi:hypothetical protein